MWQHPLLDELLKDQPADTRTQVRDKFGKIISNFEFIATVPSFVTQQIIQKAGDMGIAVFCLAGKNTSGLYGTAMMDEQRIAEVLKWVHQVAVSGTKVAAVWPKRTDTESQLGKCKSAGAGLGIPFNRVPCINDASFVVRFDAALDGDTDHPFCTSCFKELLILFKNLEDRIEEASPFTYVLRVK